MQNNQLIANWKNGDALNVSQSPAGNVKIEEELIGQVTGGANSAGYVCTVSGECNGGKSCWEILDEFIKSIF